MAPKPLSWVEEAGRPFWLALCAIALVLLVAFKGLLGPIDVYGTVDELIFHYPTALRFADLGFAEAVRDYRSATGPLSYELSQVARPFGMDLVALRYLTLAVSLCAAVLCQLFLVRVAKLQALPATFITALILLSPAVLGCSVVFMTDNYAWLLIVATVLTLCRYRETGEYKLIGIALLLTCAAIVTRQIAIWLLIPILTAVWLRERSKFLQTLILTGVAAAPLAALAGVWHGLVPPMMAEHHTAKGLLSLRSWTMGFTLVGFYGCFLFPRSLLDEFRTWLATDKAWSAGSALFGLLCVLSSPLNGDKAGGARNQFLIDGFVLNILDKGPKVANVYLLYIPLVAFGALILAFCLRRRDRFAAFLMGCMFLVYMANKAMYQRYYDLLIVLFLAVVFGPDLSFEKMPKLRPALLIAFFCVHPFWKHAAQPSPIKDIDYTTLYSPERAAEIRSRFVFH